MFKGCWGWRSGYWGCIIQCVRPIIRYKWTCLCWMMLSCHKQIFCYRTSVEHVKKLSLIFDSLQLCCCKGYCLVCFKEKAITITVMKTLDQIVLLLPSMVFLDISFQFLWCNNLSNATNIMPLSCPPTKVTDKMSHESCNLDWIHQDYINLFKTVWYSNIVNLKCFPTPCVIHFTNLNIMLH